MRSVAPHPANSSRPKGKNIRAVAAIDKAGFRARIAAPIMIDIVGCAFSIPLPSPQSWIKPTGPL